MPCPIQRPAPSTCATWPRDDQIAKITFGLLELHREEKSGADSSNVREVVEGLIGLSLGQLQKTMCASMWTCLPNR